MKEITLPKILIGEVKSQANLKSSYQVAKVMIVPKINDLPSKIGLEVKLIPISSDMKIDEERFKPKSIYFVKNEISNLDILIQLLIKARWIFYLSNFEIPPEHIEPMVHHFLMEIRDVIYKGIKEREMYEK
jgi:hypothetical protein